jgi:hypothetical protein
MMAYPTEAQKGMFISIFWTIFNLGGVMGSSVAFGTSFKNTVSDTYIYSRIGRRAHVLHHQTNSGEGQGII